MAYVQILCEMGFEKEKAEYALQMTNNKGVEPAMEWLLAHVDEEIPKQATASSTAGENLGSGGAPTSSSAEASSTPSNVVKSFKCEDCGKVCGDHSQLEFHATKTGHTNFSESSDKKKPLTEEEKKSQLALIEEKLKKKRVEREEREKADAVERERNRIKSGKDMTEARKRMEELEMQKIIEQRKREKAEEKAARERVRAQIEADKAARKEREQNHSVSSTTHTNSVSSPTSNKPPSKEYTETRIQIRLQDGSTLTETFNVKEQLSAVRVFIQMKTGNDLPFSLMTSFPRKVFDIDDFDKPLEALGLVPSAVLIVTKSVM